MATDEDRPLGVSDEDRWRAYNRARYNETHGKKGAWLRARDGVQVPRWYLDRLTKQDGIVR